MLMKKFATLIAVTMVTASLAGCGGGSANSSASSNTAGTQQAAQDTAGTQEATQDTADSASPASSGDVTNVVLWGSWAGDGMERVVSQLDEFNKEHDTIQTEYILQQEMEKKLLTGIASGNVPDVLLWDRFQTSLYAPKGALAQIDDYVAKDGIDLNIFYEEAVKEMQYDGKLYGLPFVVDNRAFFYNKGLFEEVGLDPEKPPANWAELEEMAIKLTKWENGKLVRAGFSLSDVGLFNTWIQQAGGQMLSDDQTKTAFNSEAGLTVLNFWNKMLNEDKVYALGFDAGLEQGEDPFITEKVAMKWDGPWAIANLNKYADTLDYGVAPLPAGPNGHTGAIMGGFGLAIANKAKNPDAAWELIKWWSVEAENNMRFASVTGNIPANIEAANDPLFIDDPHFGGIVKNMDYAIIRPPVVGYSEMEGNAVIANLQLFMSGDMTAEAALADAQVKGDKILADNRDQ